MFGFFTAGTGAFLASITGFTAFSALIGADLAGFIAFGAGLATA
jgi:hypothetical protein